MFEKIIVADELYPVREAAREGDLSAMFNLADHVVRGKHTRQCGETAFEIINAMFDHKSFTQDLPRVWEVFKLCSLAEQLLYREGKSSFKEFIKCSCDYLQWMIEAIISAPRQRWDYRLLAYGIDWIKEHDSQYHEGQKT